MIDTKALREKIIDLAMRGKLVPQDPNDEPASELLKRIKAEKEELIKQKKIKRDKNETEIFRGDDGLYYEKFADGTRRGVQLPFGFPDWWDVQRFNSLISLVRGSSPRPIKNFVTTDEVGVNWIKIGDTEKDGKYIESTAEKITVEGSKKSRAVFEGEFLLSNSMSFGRPYILKIDGFIHDGWFALRHFNIAYDSDFLYLLISSKLVNSQFLINATGSTVKNISSDIVNATFMPLPPIEEQKRIVKVANELLQLVDGIEEEQQQLQELSAELKKKVLDVAMQGKLVPQDPNDEPASVLLGKISNEKQKLYEEGKLKKKDLEETTIIKGDDNAYYEKFVDGTVKEIKVPYQVPENWQWTRIDQLAQAKGGKRVPKGMSLQETKTQYPYLRVTDMKNETILTKKLQYASEEVRDKIKNYMISSDDVYITIAGTIGDAGIVPIELDGALLTENALKLVLFSEVNQNFLVKIINSNVVQNQFTALFKQVAQPKLSIKSTNSTLVPLPPLKEQERIVRCFNEVSQTLAELD
ncbi:MULTISPECIES: restriction endonuclease subunit S [Bacillus cereus group]|uniref:restriction endonuclease subunit S n=1 Tax=Bacillus cereus group TaxID=86661 RepID=UPI000BFC5ECC|nr:MULTISPECIES: restriction endonuclease subunit S [Bacillus cereus group]PGT15364.1 restriction endonuclease subunit S [Bacillus cereus]